MTAMMAYSRAFSSEVETGSHRNQVYADCVDLSAVENASNQKSGVPFRFNRNGKGSSISRWSGALGVCAIIAIIRPAHADPRAVVELFTSQGCASCPPADKIIGELG